MNGIIFMKCKNSNFNVMMALKQRKVFKWIPKNHASWKSCIILCSRIYSDWSQLSTPRPNLSTAARPWILLFYLSRKTGLSPYSHHIVIALLSPYPQSSTAHKCLCTVTHVHIYIQTHSWNVLSGVSWPIVISFMFQDPPEIPPFQEGLPKAQS